jgi:hypothetical protein
MNLIELTQDESSGALLFCDGAESSGFLRQGNIDQLSNVTPQECAIAQSVTPWLLRTGVGSFAL